MYTDGQPGYKFMSQKHETVNHTAGEYVRGDVHTNSVESFWALLKRGYHGTYHQISFKHLQRYLVEFTARQNVRGLATVDQMVVLVRGMEGKRLTFRDLVDEKKVI